VFDNSISSGPNVFGEIAHEREEVANDDSR
jgi:hypothetical protein